MVNIKKRLGFSLIELLVAVVILSILLLLSYSVYKSSIDRAKITSTKANMRVLQAALELYSVNSNGTYPATVEALKSDSKLQGYWKDLNNPVTLAIDPITDLSLTTSVSSGGIGYRGGSEDPFLASNIKNLTSYSIIGADPSGNIISNGDGVIFVLTNGNYSQKSSNSTTKPSSIPTAQATPTLTPILKLTSVPNQASSVNN